MIFSFSNNFKFNVSTTFFIRNMTFPKLFEIWYFHVQIIKLFADSNAILNFCPGDFCFIPYLVSTSNITRSRNGVKNHTFPASKIFHERITSTIMNF